MLGQDFLGYDSKYIKDAMEGGRQLVGDPNLFLHYFTGEGKDVPLFEDQNDIDNYIETFHKEYKTNIRESDGELGKYDGYYVPGGEIEKNVWYESRNPDFPKEDGWEFLQYNDFTKSPTWDGAYSNIDKLEENKAYNLLGRTSTMRRRQDTETKEWEYQIVEDWDLIKGNQIGFDEYFERVLDHGEKVGVREFAYYDNNPEYEFGMGLEKWYDFDRNNYTPEEFDMVLQDLNFTENLNGFTGATLSDLPYVKSHRTVHPDIADKVMKYAPDLFERLDDDKIEFNPNYYGIKYLAENAQAYSVTGTSFLNSDGEKLNE